MVKTVLKELIIILLLCAAIILLLSVLFYDNNPITKVIPNKIAYTTPENVQNALKEETVNETIEMQNRIYRVEGSDLNIYMQSKTYDPSKENPFATTSDVDAGTTIVDGGDNNSKPNSNNNQNGQTQNKVTQPKTGLK